MDRFSFNSKNRGFDRFKKKTKILSRFCKIKKDKSVAYPNSDLEKIINF